MSTDNCSPTYTYRPNFIPSPIECIAPVFVEHRSRLFIGGTYFRSFLIVNNVETQSSATNNISLTLTKGIENPTNTFLYTLTVSFLSNIVEIYTTTQDATTSPICSNIPINLLRNDVNVNSEYISMPIRGSDVEYDDMGEDDACLSEFVQSPLIGGSGGPTDGTSIASIRTGPDRTIFIVSTTEDIDGQDIAPSVSKRVNQWDGNAWITYIPNADCR